MAGIFDTHTHYMSQQFDGGLREQIFARFAQDGVELALDCGVDYESTVQSLAYGETCPAIYTAAGIHPHETGRVGLEELERIKPLYKNPRVKAVGECGLDYHYDFSPRDVQKKLFEAQLILANELNLPVVVHDREAHADTFELLKLHRPKGVLHCYSGSAELARELVKLGFYIGFTGVITFKNARKTIEAVEAVPLDRLLLETDCPWMAPEPVRGRVSESGMIKYTAAKMAEIKGVTPQAMVDIANANGRLLFNI